MRIFVTGATGFIGSVLVTELLQSGHEVLGLTRSEAGAQALLAAGAEPKFGNLEDLDSLRDIAAESDGVIHLAFNHDFLNFEKSCDNDRKAIEAIGKVLLRSKRPFVVTSPTGIAENVDGKPSTEESLLSAWNPRASSEIAVKKLLALGVNASVVRLPQVHDTRMQGLVTYLHAVARAKRMSAYIEKGVNRWPAVHVSDAARLYRLALQDGQPGSIYHAVAEEGISMKAIAEALGRGLKVPVVSIQAQEAEAHFGWLSVFSGVDMPSSSQLTTERLNWKPNGPGLIADMDEMDYAEA